MSRQDHLASQFERHRPHLRAVAYRMLGSVAEAEDAVQEAWVRLDRGDPGGDEGLRGWLTVVVGRICLDMLRARRARREVPSGSWLPEPIVEMGGEPGPEQQAVMADSVGIALMLVLEQLTPAERLAFVLHDVFGIPFDRIAGVVERSPAAARQLASRARRRIRAAGPSPDADVAVQGRLVDAFLAAARSGDFAALLEVLAPDAVFRIDAGQAAGAARPPITGAEAVARELLGAGRPFAPMARPATVNGVPGAVAVTLDGRPVGVVAFTVRDGRIAAVDLIADPVKLRGVRV